MKEEIIIRRRSVTCEDLKLIKDLIVHEGIKGRTHISRRLCRIWDWRQPNGLYKEIACRELLRRLEQRGLITLPPRLRTSRRAGYKNKTDIVYNIDTSLLDCRLSDFRCITIELVRDMPRAQLYKGLIGKYHYLGYRQGTGEHLKYLVYGDGRVLSCIGFSSAAWRVSCRDQFIGWVDEIREKNLFKIVNNNRFLILPWVRVFNLASYILAHLRVRLPGDWVRVYNHSVVLGETFVERGRFLGTCYRADNWIYLGETSGRGRNDRYSRNKVPIKDVYVHPLTKNFREVL